MQETKRVKNPGKQRKMHFNAPAHLRHKLMAAPLSSELAASRGTKTLPVRKGDTVRIQRGDNKGFEGKVSRVDPKHYRVYLEGLTREKVDGTNIFLSVHPSKIQIRNLNLDDKRRKAILERKKETEKPEKEKAKTKETKKTKKPQEEIEAKVEEVVEEKAVEATPIEEKVTPEVAKEQTPTEKVPEQEAKKALKIVPAVKKAVVRKPVAKKPAAKKQEVAKKEETSVDENAPTKKVTKPKAVAKKTAAPKEKVPAEKTAEKKAVAKPRAKRKISEEGGQ